MLIGNIMDPQISTDEMDFKHALFASYANIAMVEVKLANQAPASSLRPSHKEILYLHCIWTKPDCTATDLVEMFGSSKALVSQTIISMEQKGYIVRTKDPKDNRRQIISLSPTRLSESSRELELIDKSIKDLSSRFSEEEMLNAARIIYTYTQNMLKYLDNDK